jgi:hypothetical protein
MGLAAVLSSARLAAQDLKSRVKDSTTIGVQVGIALSRFTGTNVQGAYPGGQNIVGFRGGANVDIPLVHSISLRPELLITQKGYKVTRDSLYIRTQINYLKVPVNIVFTLLSLDRGTLVRDFLKIGVGPYLAYAVFGHYTTESTKSDVEFTQHPLPPGVYNYPAYYKHFDAGINYFLEVNLGRFYSQVGASMGFTNIKPPVENAPYHQTVRNACFNLSYGWRF